MRSNYLQILKEFAKKVQIKYPNARIWVFGSYARGTATKDSDLDVCIVLKRLEPEDRLIISDMAWEVGFMHDFLISTVVVSEEKFESGPISAGPLCSAIRHEGVAV